MSRCIDVYSFVARNHGGIPFSGVCPMFNGVEARTVVVNPLYYREEDNGV